MKPFLLNPARMAFLVPDVLGALLFSGSKGGIHPFPGNGDCILLDGAHGLVGLADGSERSPEASRVFLLGISDRLRASPAVSEGDRVRCFHAAVQGTLDSFRYEERTTFVCLSSGRDGSMEYVCGGDSLLLHLDPSAARIRFRNRANMGFAGRSRRIVDSGRLVFRAGDLVLLATDGVWDLTDGNSDELVRAFFRGLKDGPFHGMPERLTVARHPAFRTDSSRPHDDFGVLLLDPYRLGDLHGRMLAGGTRGEEEFRYRQQLDRGNVPDRYLPVPPRKGGSWVFPEDLSALIPDADTRLDNKTG
jgi:hypothetical protein